MMTNMVFSEQIQIEDRVIEVVEKYLYLGHEIRIGRDNQTCEMLGRINLEWAAYGKLKDIF